MALGVKNPPANAGDLRDAGFIPGSGRSPRGCVLEAWQPTPVFLPENLVDRGACRDTGHRDHTELDTTEAA